MGSFIKLHEIDISKCQTARQELASKVVDALENTGFLRVTNIPDLDCDLLYKCCEWFFNQSEEIKDEVTRKLWNPKNENLYRGYFPVIEGEPSRKECYDFARDVSPDDKTVKKGNWFYEKAVWPKEDGTVPFKTIMRKSYEVMHETALEILRLAAIGLGIEENVMANMFLDKPLSQLRILHYPPWEGRTPPKSAYEADGKLVTTPVHTDSGFVTLLTTFHFPGLEVMTVDGKWAAVEPKHNTLVMNIGDTFSRMLGGRFKATKHRVLDIGGDRFSAPFFLSPGFDTDINVNFLSRDQEGKHVPQLYGPWVLKTLKGKNYFEYRDLPDIDF